MSVALCNARIVTDGKVFENHAVIIDGTHIRDIVPETELRGDSSEETVDLGGHWLLPGFIDTQVNGGGGALFNDAPNVATIRRIGEAHRRFGTTGFLPTLISDDPPALEQAIAAVQEAIEQGVPGVLGIHLEGPFLNPARKGIHDARKFGILDEKAVHLLTAPRLGRTLVTLAPEMTTSQTIQRLSEAGVIVCAGHTNATYAVTREALAHGLRGFTHLFNAMSPLTAREPGVTGAALEDPDSWCGIIADGHHVSAAALRIAVRCKPAGKLLLVTDAMSGVGTTPPPGRLEKHFTFQNRALTVRNGVCRDERGVLGGSDLDMASAVRNTVNLLQTTLAQAAAMASANPAAFLRLDGELGRIAAGYRANLVAMDDSLHVVETWVDGGPAGRLG